MSSQFLSTAVEKMQTELAELKVRIAAIKTAIDAAGDLATAQTEAAGLDELVDVTPAVTTEIDTITNVGTSDTPGTIFGR